MITIQLTTEQALDLFRDACRLYNAVVPCEQRRGRPRSEVIAARRLFALAQPIREAALKEWRATLPHAD